MSRTHRSDSAFVSGYHHSGDRGLGFAGSTIPSTGTHGPALLYPGLDLPAENDAEFRLVFLTIPSGLSSFEAGEDSSIAAAAAAPGTYSGTYEAYKDGVSYGVATWTLHFGSGLSGSLQLDDLVPTGTLGSAVVAVLSGAVVLDGLLPTGHLAGVPLGSIDPGAHALLRFLLRPPVRVHTPEPPQRRFPLRHRPRRLPVLQGSPRTSAMPTERINPGAKLRFELDLRPADTSKPAWLMTGDRITAATWSVGTGLTKVADSHTDTVATVLLEAAADVVVGTKLVATCTFTTEQGERDSRRLELEVVRQ